MTICSDSINLDEFDAVPDRLPALIARFQVDQDCLHRLLQVPYSAVRRERLRRFLECWRQTCEQITFDTLTRSDRADWLLLRSRLDADVRELDQEERGLAIAASLLQFADSLVALEERRLALEDVEAEAAAETLDRADTQVQEICTALKNGTRTVCITAAGEAVQIVSRLHSMLKSWFTFYHGYDPLFTWWVEAPYHALEKRLMDYGVFLREAAVGAGEEAILGSPIGRDALMDELRSAQIAYTPEELIAAGQAEISWCRRELSQAAREMGYGDDWRAALDQVKRGHVAPGRQPALVRRPCPGSNGLH